MNPRLTRCSQRAFAAPALFAAALSWVIGFTCVLAGSPTALAQRDLTDIPDPDPELERASFVVAEGFEVNLFASDPLMAKPIQMNWDAQGRLWIATSEVYPHIKPGQEADDKILVLEDADRDGVADKTTVFARGLLSPTGVAPGDGGCYVANSTELIHLTDEDGDGKADQRRVVLSGFGTEDTHHLLHTLRWGSDGWLYMNQSIYIHSHVETPYGVQRLNGGGIWRFRPDRRRLQVFCEGFVNPWGHEIDAWGQSFATDGAYGEGINYVFPGAVFVTAPGAKRVLAGLNPGSPKHCGLAILSGGHLPESWRGNMITNDFRAHRVCRFVVTEDESGYASRQEEELIKTEHVAFRPIDVKMGPDGAIYIADWYNPIIQHGEVDFRDPRRDHVHGRIWRVTAKGRPLVQPVDPDSLPLDELCDLLKASEDWVRLHAKFSLRRFPVQEAMDALDGWLERQPADHPDYEQWRLEALWAAQVLDREHPRLLTELLESEDHRVRAAAVRVSVDWLDRLPDLPQRWTHAVHDPHPRVRLEAVRALAAVPQARSAWAALEALEHPMDRFLDFALWRTMRQLEPRWLPAWDRQAGRLTPAQKLYALAAADSPAIREPLAALLQEPLSAAEVRQAMQLLAQHGGPSELGGVLRQTLGQPLQTPESATVAADLILALVETTRARKTAPEGDLGVLAKALDCEHQVLQAAAARAVGAWRVGELRDVLQRWFTAAETPAQVRWAAIEGERLFGDAQARESLRRLASEGAEADRPQALSQLAALAPRLAAELTADWLGNLPPEQAEAGRIDLALGEVLARQPAVEALSEALQGATLPPDVAQLALRAAQRSARPAVELLEALRAAGGLQSPRWKASPELTAELVREVSESGDAVRGQAVYRREALQCQKCHAIAGAGGRVGPDLASIGGSAQVDYLIESLLEPNKKVKENYHGLIVQTDEGKTVAGVVVRRDARELVLRDAEDREIVIPAALIEAEQESRSLMPDGLTDALTRQELTDLVRFLSELGKVGGVTADRSPVVRRWEALVPTQESYTRIRRTSYDSAAEDHPDFQWKPVYSRVDGSLPLADVPDFTPAAFVTQDQRDRIHFLRCVLDVREGGSVRLNWNSPAGVALYLDGRPTPLSEDSTYQLAAGEHVLTLVVSPHLRSEADLRLEVQPGSETPAQVEIR